MNSAGFRPSTDQTVKLRAQQANIQQHVTHFVMRLLLHTARASSCARKRPRYSRQVPANRSSPSSSAIACRSNLSRTYRGPDGRPLQAFQRRRAECAVRCPQADPACFQTSSKDSGAISTSTASTYSICSSPFRFVRIDHMQQQIRVAR